jgi:hypothetical protein
MKDQIYEIRITLHDTKPPIWRTVAVAGDITLGQLHEVIQITMGWTDSHLHQFIQRDKALRATPAQLRALIAQERWDEVDVGKRGERVFTDPEFAEVEFLGEDENRVTLAGVCPKVKSKLIYEYDFGDGWEHAVEVQKIYEPKPDVEYPVCLAGRKACPPEDCGGVWGYYDMLEALADPKHERHEELSEWIGGEIDPEVLELEEVNAILAEWRASQPRSRRRPSGRQAGRARG